MNGVYARGVAWMCVSSDASARLQPSEGLAAIVRSFCDVRARVLHIGTGVLLCVAMCVRACVRACVHADVRVEFVMLRPCGIAGNSSTWACGSLRVACLARNCCSAMYSTWRSHLGLGRSSSNQCGLFGCGDSEDGSTCRMYVDLCSCTRWVDWRLNLLYHAPSIVQPGHIDQV